LPRSAASFTFSSIGLPQTIRARLLLGFRARSICPDGCRDHGGGLRKWRRIWRNSPTAPQKAMGSCRVPDPYPGRGIPHLYHSQGNASRPSNNLPMRRSHSPLLGAPCRRRRGGAQALWVPFSMDGDAPSKVGYRRETEENILSSRFTAHDPFRRVSRRQLALCAYSLAKKKGEWPMP
jgi:hypothetical protein